MLFELSRSGAENERSFEMNGARVAVAVAAVAGCLAILAPAAAAAESAVHARVDGPDLVFEGPPGARIVVLDAAEEPVARGRINGEGRLVLKDQAATDAMLLLVEVDGTRGSLSALMAALELVIVSPPRVAAGLPIVPHLRVVERGSSTRGVEGVGVQLWLKCGSGPRMSLGALTSDVNGVATAGQQPLPVVPEAADGTCTLRAVAEGATLEASVNITRGARVMVSTDRPIYEPGQRVHMRGLAMDLATSRPLKATRGKLELVDDYGNVHGRRPVTTSRFGLTDTVFTLKPGLSTDHLIARFTLGGQVAQRRLKVGRFEPPKVTVEITPTRDAYGHGDELVVQVEVARLDGGPPAGSEVELIGRTPAGRRLFRTTGQADADGLAVLTGKAPAAGEAFELVAHAETTGGQRASAQRLVPIDSGALKVWIVPESGKAISGLRNGFWVVTQKPDGSPAPAAVKLSAGSARVEVRTNDAGIAFAELSLPRAAREVEAAATGDGRTGAQKLGVSSASGGAVLHLERAVLDAGDTIIAELRTSHRQASAAFFDLVQQDHAVASRSSAVVDGVARVRLPIPARGAAGSLRVHAWTLDGDAVVGDTRLVLVRDRRDLSIEMTPDQETYRPREEARVSIRVTDADGQPVVAGLSLVAVDAGLRALGLEQPGLEAALARLSKHWDGPKAAEAPPWARDALLLADDRQRLAVLASTVDAAVRLSVPKRSEAIRRAAAMRAFRPAMQGRVDRLAKALTRYYTARRSRRGRKVLPRRLFQLGLLAAGDMADPWGRTMRLTWDLEGGCCRYTVSLRSGGIDGRSGTADDVSVSQSFEGYGTSQCGCTHAMFGVGRGGGGFGLAGMSLASGGRASRSLIPPELLRTEFPDTLAVEPELITDEDGRATWTVRLADSLTTWLVQARAISEAGGLGGAEAELRVQQPFFVDISLPAVLLLSDEIELPVSVTNRTRTARTVDVVVSAGGSLQGALDRQVVVEAGETAAVAFHVKAATVGDGWIQIESKGGGVADGMRRSLAVEPDGVPVGETRVGTVRSTAPVTVGMEVPSGGIAGTRRLDLRLYAGAVGAVVEDLDALLRAPSGCFEQTSSTTYPNALVLDYLQRTDKASPQVAGRARAFLDEGWKRLTSFEVSGGGFSWFGDAPANKILSAFGVMEFERIGLVKKVDPRVATRTREWLLGQRRADGAWDPDASFLHAESWSRIQNAALPVTAYIVWALARSGTVNDLTASVAWLRAHAAEANDTYVLGMVALALSTVAPTDSSARDARQRLVAMATETEAGRQWRSETPTHTHARGSSAHQETTALALLALLAGGEDHATAQDALDQLLSERRPRGGWWTTQATVLALEGLLEHAAAAAAPAEGTVQVRLAGDLLARLDVTPADFDVVRTVELPPGAGRRDVSLEMVGDGGLRFQLAGTRMLPVAAAPKLETPPLAFSVTADRTRLALGETARVTVTLATTGSVVRMPTVTVGIPAGFELDDAGLDNIPQVARWEVIGRRLVLYLLRLDASDPMTASFGLTARRRGRVSAGAAVAWPYYEPDRKLYLETTPFVVE